MDIEQGVRSQGHWRGVPLPFPASGDQCCARHIAASMFPVFIFYLLNWNFHVGEDSCLELFLSYTSS